MRRLKSLSMLRGEERRCRETSFRAQEYTELLALVTCAVRGHLRRTRYKQRTTSLLLIRAILMHTFSPTRTGDRPKINEKRTHAWQRYCAICDDVFKITTFYSKHGGLSVMKRRTPINFRAKHHLKMTEKLYHKKGLEYFKTYVSFPLRAARRDRSSCVR